MTSPTLLRCTPSTTASVDAVAGKLPRVAEHLDAARADVLAFTGFPKELWRQIWSNNPLSVNRLSGDTVCLAA